jgi:hypothetical protein
VFGKCVLENTPTYLLIEKKKKKKNLKRGKNSPTEFDK